MGDGVCAKGTGDGLVSEGVLSSLVRVEHAPLDGDEGIVVVAARPSVRSILS